MRKSLMTILGALAVMGGAAASPVYAGPEVNTSTGIVLVDGKPGPSLAVRGYDVVAYFTEGKPVLGDANFAAKYGQASYRFASQADLDAFKADPAKYVPAYGGYCAYGVSVGAKFDADPTLWTVDNGHLYLNLDKNIQGLFLKDVSGAIKKADKNWPGLEHKVPKS